MVIPPDGTPYAEAPWLGGIPSPFYKESHRKWQQTCRQFIQEHIGDQTVQWMKDGQLPPDLYTKFAEAGMILPCMPSPRPIKHLQRLGVHGFPGGLKLEEFDYFHYLIYVSEMYHCGLCGPAGTIVTGLSFGTPPIVNYGSKELQDRLLPGLLSGKTRSCIAVTEPDAGSDVANLTTTATKEPDGKHYRVNGSKKWISSGIWADYATTAVRTGGPGAGGISMLVVPLKNTPGVSCRSMDISNGKCFGTTYIDFDDVLVPADNLLGIEGEGLKCILTNFNHERLSMAIGALAQARKVLSATFAYTTKRQAFGKRLIDQQIVRHHLANMGLAVEAEWARIEQIAYALGHLSKEDADRLLASRIALSKVGAGKVLQECVSHAQILFGGNGVTRTGQGELIEAVSREVGLTRIPGGSEDILLDFATRQILKLWEKQSTAKANL